MKNLLSIVLLLAAQTFALAQIKGNGNLVTKTFGIEGLQNLEVGLYAKVIVDMKAEAIMQISAEENLMSLISTQLHGDRLKLDQKEWIQPQKQITIKIGAPDLKRIQQNTHESTLVTNISIEEFRAMAIVGTIRLEGEVKRLSASAETGNIDATALKTSEVQVNVWGPGRILLDAPEKISGKTSDDGKIVYQSGQPKVSVKMRNGGTVQSAAASSTDEVYAPFIKFKLENNSDKRINAYVRGPKADGSYFGYGFPMNPGQVREKDWSVGSKVYRVSKLGTRKLILEIKAGDEGKTVRMFSED